MSHRTFPVHPFRRSRGFTLLELMMALTVLAVVMSVAVPSFRGFTANQKIRTAGFDLTSDLMLARSEALKRNGNVVIRAGGGGWQEGWTVLVAGPDTVLRSRNSLGSHVTFSGAPASVTFNGSGRVSDPAGPVRMQINVSSGSVPLYRCIVLDPSGRPKSLAESCS